jgi:type II secretory pathway pseudopilin PulG
MRRRSPHPARSGAGFTLIETALATVIVGVGVLALMEAHQAFLRTNSWSTHTSTATLLANELREMTRHYPRHDSFAGGIYFQDPENHTGFQGWGPEGDELDASMFDDLDDFDGVVFGDAAEADLPGPIAIVDDVPMRFPGPINAFSEVIPETLWNGTTALDDEDADLPLQGWTQYVQVDKVDPIDFTTTIDDDYFEPAAGGDPERRVDQFPVRVTVWTLYQGPFDTEAEVVAQHTWVVPE